EDGMPAGFLISIDLRPSERLYRNQIRDSCRRYGDISKADGKISKSLTQQELLSRTYNSRRPSSALAIVTSSAYSMSLPAGMPVAIRVTFTPDFLTILEM